MAYSKQTWDTNSVFNPTRMNHIEDGIASASTASGTEYSSGVSVADKIYEGVYSGVIDFGTPTATISITGEQKQIGNTWTGTLPEGKYIAIGSVNASWGNPDFSLIIYVDVDGTLKQGGGFSRAQTNTPCCYHAEFYIPTTGTHTIKLIGESTSVGKQVDILDYQSVKMALIKVY